MRDYSYYYYPTCNHSNSINYGQNLEGYSLRTETYLCMSLPAVTIKLSFLQPTITVRQDPHW